MKKYPRNPPPLRGGHGSRRPHPIQGRTSRNANLTTNITSDSPLTTAPLELGANSDSFSHIRVIPKPPSETAPEQKMQCTNPVTFKKVSFSEEAEANLSSYSNPYNWQANLANASDGSSFAQKARAAELNAARARKAAQMQSVDDEIPDLSGPVSLGMYKFTLRGRGKRYERHRLIELQNENDRQSESENKVTGTAPTSSANSPFNPLPSATPPSSQLSGPSNNQTKAELNDSIINCLDNPSPDRRAFQQPDPRHFREVDPFHSAVNYPALNRSTYSSRPSPQASGRVKSLFQSSFPPAQVHRSTQGYKNPETPTLEAPGQAFSSFQPEHHRSNLHLTATIHPDRQSPRQGFGQAGNSSWRENHSLNQNSNALIDTDRGSLEALRQAHPSFPPSDRRLDTHQQCSQFTKSLRTLVESKQRSLKVSAQASSLLPAQSLQPRTSDLYCTAESKADKWLETQIQSSQARGQAQFPATPKEYASPQSLPLSDTLPTASFNLETDHWDPDLPEANMSAQTPTNKSTGRGHSGQQSSGKSQVSYTSQDIGYTPAIVTTTKSGRPYTNPYMPIYPLPSTARQSVGDSPSGQLNPSTQSDDAELVQRQRKTRYVDQEEARLRALIQFKREHIKESLDDPFQDQTTPIQQYGRNQPSNYAEYAANQATYGQLADYPPQLTPTAYASDPNASAFFTQNEDVQHALDTGRSPYHGQRSAYEQHSVRKNRAQNPAVTVHEQRSAYEQANPRASVRLPAVRGTTNQQRLFLQEPELGSLSLEDSLSKNVRDPRHRQTQGGTQPVSGRVSHAVPIRDPAAYTGSGLSSRRNQEALRQNLDTVVGSSQVPTGTARTVMNDPHRDRQLSGRPSPTTTDTTVTGSTLRAQAPSYEFLNTQRPETTNPSVLNLRPDTSQRQDKGALGGRESLPLQTHVNPTLQGSAPENMYYGGGDQTPATPPGFGHDVATYTKNAGLPIEAIGAGNKFMNALAKQTAPKLNSQQRLEDAKAWFCRDPRDLSYAAAVLPYETMNKMNAKQFPLEDRAPRTVFQLADESQDDDPSDRAGQAATPRPIGHGRPAGFPTPPGVHGPRRAANQAPVSTFASTASANDKEAMERADRKFLEDDAKAIEAMFGGVYSNLMSAKNGPYDYMNHYCPPPAYAIDHNARNNNTFFDPQWFATAPPARVGRDPRREQGEYEDPTHGSTSRRGDHARAEVIRRDSGGRGGTGGRAWGRN